MSDLSEARANVRERLAATGIRGLRAERLAEGSVRRVADKIDRGANPAPDETNRDAFRRRGHDKR